jgi:hypothetical protein
MPEDLSGTAIDHIIPKCRGGPDKPWNYQRLHATCNGPAGKGSILTLRAIELAAAYGIVLREPRSQPLPPVPLKPRPHKVAVRRLYEVACYTCECVIGFEDSWERAQEAKRDHIALARGGHENESAALAPLPVHRPLAVAPFPPGGRAGAVVELGGDLAALARGLPAGPAAVGGLEGHVGEAAPLRAGAFAGHAETVRPRRARDKLVTVS